MKTGLIIVDVQNDYFAGGSMELVDMNEAAANCRKLLDFFRVDQAPVFHIQHIANREGATIMAALSAPFARVISTDQYLTG